MTSRLRRFPLLAAGLATLTYGVWVGLARLGWLLPLGHPAHLTLHGPLMVSGFLGTVIGLERAVALERPWTYGGPILAALGTAFSCAAPGSPAGLWLALGSSAILVAVYGVVMRRQPTLFTAVMGVGAGLWLAANALLLLGTPLPRLVFLWAAFPVLTIAGERLELTRFLKPTRFGHASFLAVVAVLLLGAALVPVAPAPGHGLTGLGLLALALWLGRFDVARRTVRQHGLTRFVAVCLLSGYAWLAIAGLLTVAFAARLTGPAYDAALHSLFLGFVFSMIYGHAPIVFPAVLRATMSFKPAFYGHLALLHASLLARVAGDLGLAQGHEAWAALRLWGGLLNGVSIAVFLAVTVSSLGFQTPKGTTAAPIT